MNVYSNNFTKQFFNIVTILKFFVVEKSDFKKNITASLLFIASLFVSTNAYSNAGDLISNTATISYDIIGVPAVDSASTSFTEDRRINFFVTDSNGGVSVPVISDMTNAVMQFAITNTGNDIHDFLLAAVNTTPNPYGLPADSFDPLPGTIQVFVENGVTPGYQAAQDTAVFIDELIPNIPATVYVVADLPTVVTGDVAAIALIAQVAEGGANNVEGAAINADDNGRISPAGVFSNGTTNVAAGTSASNPDTLGMESVFNDPAGTNAEDISSDLNQDVAGNGQHADAGAYQVTSPVVINKSVTVIDTLGGNDPHPGATLRYQLDVSVSGNTSVSNLIVSDSVPLNTTYTDGSILLDGIAQTDANDAPTDYSRAIDILSKPVVSIEIDLSQGSTVSVIPGSSYVIIFEVTIN